ncbi:cysteine-rich receptor-like protein kinase 8 [Tanacetum coccineum]
MARTSTTTTTTTNRSDNYSSWKWSIMIALNVKNKMKIVTVETRDCNVEVYYHKLKGFWDEYDALEAPYMFICICNCNNGRINGEKDQRKRLIQFLMGLDESYIRGKILLMQPLPSAAKAYIMINDGHVSARNDQLQNQLNQVLLMLQNNQGNITQALLIYVDDILLTGNDKRLLQSIKHQLDQQFSIKDLGSLQYYLGIEIIQNSKGLVMSQRKYALDLLQCADVLNHKPSTISLNPLKNLNLTDGDPLPGHSLYRKLVGKFTALPSKSLPNHEPLIANVVSASVVDRSIGTDNLHLEISGHKLAMVLRYEVLMGAAGIS